MAELLLVRSGVTDNPVTERFKLDSDELKQYLDSRDLHYLGAELPPIGETSRVSEFASPDHVVVNLDEGETERFRVKEQGFYVVEGLSPSDVPGS